MRRRWVAFTVVAVIVTAAILATILLKRSGSDGTAAAGNTRSVSGSLLWSGVPTSSGNEHRASLPSGRNGEFVTLDGSGRVSRRTPTGETLWSVPLAGHAGGVRPPHILADADRVYVTHDDGVTALDAADGSVRWHDPGPAGRMLLSGDLLLAAECGISKSIEKHGRWMVARHAPTGREAYRVRLPTSDFDPHPLRESTGLFVVQHSDPPSGDGLAILLDRSGAEHYRLDREVVTIRPHADGKLILTGRGVVRLSAAGVVEWSTPFEEYTWLAGGEFVPVSGGSMLAFVYCQIADSGVRILRFDPARGGKGWEATCPGLRVPHSAYYHAASVEPVGNQLRVISRGSGGVFVEGVDLATGRSVHRQEMRE